jgi:hypothetical protein
VAGIREADQSRIVPSAIRAAAASGRFPGEIADAVRDGKAAQWEPVMGAWVAHRLGLPEAITESLSLGRAEAIPLPVADAVREAPPETPLLPSAAATRKASAGTTRKAAKGAARRPSDDDLMEAIREFGPGVTKYRVMADLHLGDKRAQRLLDRLAAESSAAPERPGLSAVR